MEVVNATIALVEDDRHPLIRAIFPWRDCLKWDCFLAVSFALFLTFGGLICMAGIFLYMCCKYPNRAEEEKMKRARDLMKARWEQQNQRQIDCANSPSPPSSQPVRIRPVKEGKNGGNGTDRSSSFQHVRFKDRSRVTTAREEEENVVEMQMMVRTSEPDYAIVHEEDEFEPIRKTAEEPGFNPLKKVIDPEEEKAKLRRSSSYDEVFETPRSSCASLLLPPPIPLHTDYTSDEEYLDARSRILYEEDTDSDRTLTLTQND